MSDMTDQFSSGSAEQNSIATALRQELAASKSEIAGLREMFNVIQEQFLESLRGETSVRVAADNQILELLSAESARQLSSAGHVRQELLEIMIRQRLILPPGIAGVCGASAEPTIRSVPPLVAQMAQLERLAPLNFAAYERCLSVGTESYKGLPPESCSTERHPQAMLFRAFVRPYLAGNVLDIGCGPQPIPSYLIDHPVSKIVGIDPVSTQEDHPFRFVSGFGEFLPFEDGVFDCAILGTTLDHYYLLDRGLSEVARVLKPGGRFLAWITEFAGAPAYDPYSAPMQPFDDEHMYHIDRAWFLPLMASLGFAEQEIIQLNEPFNYLFMSFQKRH